MELTKPVGWLKKSCIGYVVNTEFSPENKTVLGEITNAVQAAFGDAVFVAPPDSLHITLLDWIAPLVGYDGQDKDELFASIRARYDKVLGEIIAGTPPITIQFSEIKATPDTIIIIGTDSGEFHAIREAFVKEAGLLPGTKPPPRIIHSSIARFAKEIDVDRVNAFMKPRGIHFAQSVTDFRLVRTQREPLLEFEVLTRYPLGAAR
jgi:hypothetical protein